MFVLACWNIAVYLFFDQNAQIVYFAFYKPKWWYIGKGKLYLRQTSFFMQKLSYTEEIDDFNFIIYSQLVRQEELMAKLRDEITSLQDDVSKSTDQVQQKKALLFFCRQSEI